MIPAKMRVCINDSKSPFCGQEGIVERAYDEKYYVVRFAKPKTINTFEQIGQGRESVVLPLYARFTSMLFKEYQLLPRIA